MFNFLKFEHLCLDTHSTNLMRHILGHYFGMFIKPFSPWELLPGTHNVTFYFLLPFWGHLILAV